MKLEEIIEKEKSQTLIGYGRDLKTALPKLSSSEIEAVYRLQKLYYTVMEVECEIDFLYNHEEINDKEKEYAYSFVMEIAEEYLYGYGHRVTTMDEVLKDLIFEVVADLK